MIEYAVFDCLDLEYRAKGRRLSGRFPYNSTATISDRGTVRKEKIQSRAFSFSVDDPKRTISLLRGHDMNEALAVRSPSFKTLELEDTEGSLNFEATLPPTTLQSQHVRDTLLDVQAGLLNSLSPGFKIPPAEIVPDGETFIPEPGNPVVEIRVIKAAVLYELSLVHRGTYRNTSVELRHDQLVQPVMKHDEFSRKVMLWL